MWSDCIIGAIKKQSENIGHRKLALRVDNVYIDLVLLQIKSYASLSLLFSFQLCLKKDVWPTVG